MEPASQNLETLPFHGRRLFIDHNRGSTKRTPTGTPCIWGQYKKVNFSNLKTSVVGRDCLPKLLTDKWLEDTTFVIICSPTETTTLNIHTAASVIEQFGGMQHVCAIRIDGAHWAFYSTGLEIPSPALTHRTQSLLPYYAVPTKWVSVAEMPLTFNGKVDKGCLKGAQPLGTPPESRPASLRFSDAKDPRTGIVAVSPMQPCTTSSLTEKEVEKELVLPEKNGIQGERWLRHRFFSLYRRFFSIVWIANIVPVVVLASGYRKRQALSLQDMMTATATNLTVAVLMRQEYVINLLFKVACAVPKSVPLGIRRQCGRVFHMGGLHSGCAVMATAWFTAFTITATRYYVVGDGAVSISLAALVVSHLVVLFLLSMLVMAYPTIRAKYHNHFELVHRFSGWTALGLVWVQTVLTADSLGGEAALGQSLVQSVGFWLMAASTISVVLPWVRLRKVKVRSEKLSDHAIRLHFDYTDTDPGTVVRVSERPLMEWHAFATISEPGKKGFSLVVSNAGDWTKRQVEGCPRSMWVRGIPAYGVLGIAPLFKSMVLVATGSGIGPCLSVIMAKSVPCRILWLAPHPEKTFGEDVVKEVYTTDPKAVIHNTRTMGRPDVAAISYRLYREMGAEAVCIISNRKLTEKVVYAMESRGIPAYGAIWDS